MFSFCLPMVDPFVETCQTGVWKSPWSVAEDFGVGFCCSRRRAEPPGQEGVKCVRHHLLTGLVRIGRYIGETCDAEDGLVKVLLNVCETALSDSLGGEESDRRRSSFDPASSSHHGRQRNLRISPFRIKLKTSCTRVTKTSSGRSRNSSWRKSPSRRISASSPKKMRDWKEATKPLPPSSSAAHPEATGKRSRLSSRASWPLAKANRKCPEQSSSLTPPKEDVQRFLSKGFKIGIDGLDRSRRLFSA